MGLLRRIRRNLKIKRKWFCFINIKNVPFILVLVLAFLTLRAHLNKVIQPIPTVNDSKIDSNRLSYRLFAKYKNNLAKNCSLLSLLRKDKRKPSNDTVKESLLYGSCRRIPPAAGSCDVADKLFFSKPPTPCPDTRKFNFCSVQETSKAKWSVICNETESKPCVSTFSVGTTNATTGELDWIGDLTSLSKVAETINGQLKRTSSKPNNFGFCFISCAVIDAEQIDIDANSNDKANEYIVYGQQLLILPPVFENTPKKSHTNYKNKINVNLVFIDSVSHQHFFRSLKQSVAVLEHLSSAPNSNVNVFDFELVQAVRSRTFESLQALFAGFVDTVTKPFGTNDIPPKPLKLEVLLKRFKQQGYQTLWLEDFCQTREWGLPKDLRFMDYNNEYDYQYFSPNDNLTSDSPNDKITSDYELERSNTLWARMWRSLALAGIDNIGPTLAMCDVLEENGVGDIFLGPDAVCFKGQHQHRYLLDYLLLYQRVAHAASQPTFTFTLSNVGHEGTGRRVQTLDTALAKYIRSVADLPNTLTILLSDHGNTYGVFLDKSSEAKVEIFHPFMFMITPKNVEDILKEEIMHNLKINTRRLVSLLDLHQSLVYIRDMGPNTKTNSTRDLERQGLFSLINSSRTCSDIPRIMPNLCICEHFEKSVSNTTDFKLLAYFAIGRLNDEIYQQNFKSLTQKKKNSDLT